MKPTSRLATMAMLLAAAGLVAAEPAMAAEQKHSVAAADASGAPKPVPSSNPLSGNPEAMEQGHHLFLTWCAQCHGTTATGSKYGANLTIFALGYKEFLATVKNGRVQKQMPPWKDILDQDSISKIGAYLETLAQPGANWQ